MSRSFFVALLAAALLGGGLALSAVAADTEDTGDQLYRDGHYEKAIEWWQKAAREGSGNAAYRLGAIYADGVVVAQDFSLAARWYTVAAERGDSRAQFDLGTLYDNGFGVEKSLEKAVHWYRKAAERGEAAGQYNLGSLYEQGHGVERDLVESYKWYTLAARQEFLASKLGALERISAEMTPAEIERGEDAVLAFEPR